MINFDMSYNTVTCETREVWNNVELHRTILHYYKLILVEHLPYNGIL